jgi:hypothetical protein
MTGCFNSSVEEALPMELPFLLSKAQMRRIEPFFPLSHGRAADHAAADRRPDERPQGRFPAAFGASQCQGTARRQRLRQRLVPGRADRAPRRREKCRIAPARPVDPAAFDVPDRNASLAQISCHIVHQCGISHIAPTPISHCPRRYRRRQNCFSQGPFTSRKPLG